MNGRGRAAGDGDAVGGKRGATARGRTSAAGELPAQPWHLPGLEVPNLDPDRGEPGSTKEWRRSETAAGVSFRTPALDGAKAASLADAVREAALAARREHAVGRVVEVAASAATRLADPDSRWGRAAAELLCAELGWPRGTSRETLERMAEGWSRDALTGLLESELGDPALLDGYRPAPVPDGGPRMRRAAGPPLLLQVQAGNVPGVGITGMIRGLLARSGLLVRPSRAEPGLAALFARSLTDLAPDLGRSTAVCWWPRGKGAPWRTVVKWSSKVVVYGGEEAVRGIRGLLPGETELLPYGPRLGVAVLLPDAEPKEAARRLARDVCSYEQRGCVSPQVLLTPPGLRRAVAREVEEALGEWVKENEVAPLTPGEAGELRQLRARAEFSGEGGLRLVGDPGELRWTVLTGREPELRSEALPRVLRVYGVEGSREIGRLLSGLEGRVQALGYAGREGREELAEIAAAAGVSRITPLGRAAWPPADWRHDGRHQLLPLLRWTDWELRPGEEGPQSP